MILCDFGNLEMMGICVPCKIKKVLLINSL